MAPFIMEVIYSDRTNYVQTKFGSPDGGMHITESSQGNTPTAMVNEIAVIKGGGERGEKTLTSADDVFIRREHKEEVQETVKQ
jgi:hypothetical protein